MAHEVAPLLAASRPPVPVSAVKNCLAVLALLTLPASAATGLVSLGVFGGVGMAAQAACLVAGLLGCCAGVVCLDLARETPRRRLITVASQQSAVGAAAA